MPSNPDWGLRADGTPKNSGWLGVLKADNGDMTEYSVGVTFSGNEMEIPSVVPSLNREELEYLLKGNAPTRAIVDKAAAHAIGRIKEGKSPFWEDGDKVYEIPPKVMYQEKGLAETAKQ